MKTLPDWYFLFPLGLIPKSPYCEVRGQASEWTMPPSHTENPEAHLHTSLHGGSTVAGKCPHPSYPTAWP